MWHYRYVDENGNNYNATMSIDGPYGVTNQFTGPRVRNLSLVICMYIYILCKLAGCKRLIMQYVTGFMKACIVHISNFSTLKIP